MREVNNLALTPFRINTYKKPGGRGEPQFPFQLRTTHFLSPVTRYRLPDLPV